MIQIKNLNKFFNKKKSNEIHVVNNVSLKLPSKGMIAIFGRSGCGKTTLLNVIGGLDKFDSGDVLIDGESIKKHTDDIRNARIGYIFQNYNLDYNISIYDNVATSLKLLGIKDKEEIDRRVKAALENVDMLKYARRNPQTVSGGQQQRVAIARAIVKGSDIILADEPTGNLDEENTYMVMDILKAISKDRLVLLVTHEENLVNEYCDNIINIVDGKIVSAQKGTGEAYQGGYTGNKIYLGDLNKTEINTSGFQISYYGDELSKNKTLTIINDGKKVFLYSNDPDIKLIDMNSEMKIYEGKKEDYKERVKEDIDMETLTKIEPKKRTGRLFTFGKSFVEGYRLMLSKKAAGRKALTAILALFAMAFIVVVALVGVDIRNLNNFADTKTVYVDVSKIAQSINTEGDANTKTMQDFVSSVKNISNVSSVRFIEGMDDRKSSHTIVVGEFDTAAENFNAGVQSFDKSIKDADNLDLVAGSKTNNNYEMLVSTNLAKQIIESIGMSDISNYKNVIGIRMFVTGDRYDSSNAVVAKIVGVVQDVSPCAYFSDQILTYMYLKKTIGSGWFGTRRVYPNSMYPNVGTVEQGKVYVGKEVSVPNTLGISKYHVGDSLYVEGFKDSAQYRYTVSTVMTNSPTDPMDYESIIILNDNDYVRHLSFYLLGSNSNRYGYNTMVISVKNASSVDSIVKGIKNLNGEVSVTIPSKLSNESLKSFLPKLISLVVIIAVMCICLYFVMRSSLLSRIREVGIYRAIGVRKQNIIFKFFAESLCVITMTVLIGFLIMSAIMWKLMTYGTAVYSMIYYPVWVGFIALVFLYAVCIFISILPVMTLMNKRPAEILSKYDI